MSFLLNRSYALKSVSLFVLVSLLSACDKPVETKAPQPSKVWPKIDWRADGEAQLKKAKARQVNNGTAKNIILFIGDGMSVSTVTAARILEGQMQGHAGEENLLSFEHFPYTAMSKTYNVDRQTPDSAGTASAMLTGIKTVSGVISVDETVTKGDCSTLTADVPVTLLELAEQAGMSTGVVTTATITHATPASTYAHSVDRGWESDAKMALAPKSAGCIDIATQLVMAGKKNGGDGLEVALGGGRGNFLPNTQADPFYADKMGHRLDGIDLTAAWLSRYEQGQYIWNADQLAAVDAQDTDHLLGLFDYGHMAFAVERSDAAKQQPSLVDLTDKAIDILAKNPKGFFLMVEAGRIDHGHHGGNAYRALTDTIELSEAVKLALDKTDPEETLILVTADHSHVFTIAGYAKRGTSILGLGGVDSNGAAYTTLGYANGPGAVNGARPDLVDIDTEAQDYRQQALVARKSESHSGEDVVIYGHGVKSHLLGGVVEQSFLFYLMEDAAQLKLKAARHQNATVMDEIVEDALEGVSETVSKQE